MSASSEHNASEKLMNVQVIAESPKPLIAISYSAGLEERILADVLSNISHTLAQHLTDKRAVWTYARGVTLDRLPVVMQTGVDVTPTTAPIYVSDIAKALEYGGPQKVLILFKRTALDRTFRAVDATLDPTELAALRTTFPTIAHSQDGSTLWLSRLPEGHRHRAKSFEMDYIRWIPGDPWEALLAVFVLGTDLGVLLDFIRKVQRECRAVIWQ